LLHLHQGRKATDNETKVIAGKEAAQQHIRKASTPAIVPKSNPNLMAFEAVKLIYLNPLAV